MDYNPRRHRNTLGSGGLYLHTRVIAGEEIVSEIAGGQSVTTTVALGAVAIATALFAAVATAGKGGDGGKGKDEDRPNIVVLMTDDQTVESLRVMPKLDSLLADQGVSFTNSFASNPVCCPSRATFLTGQYAHNNGVYRNSEPNGGFTSLDGSRTLPVWLERAGYFTAHIGKYLNGYGSQSPPTEIPPGWSEWYGSIDRSTYRMHGYTLNENGTLRTYGHQDVEDPATYQTDVYAQKATELIARRAPKRKPFFLSLAPLAPHGEVLEDENGLRLGGPRAAPRHEGAYASERLPQSPSLNEADVSDKPAEIEALPRLSRQRLAATQARYRDRLESLLAVDDMVESVINELRDAGEMSDTVLVFTSDNGYLLGEHRIASNKQYLYEESIRVPLIVRGPGIPEGKTRKQPVANLDLAPTILHYADAKADLALDGRPLHRLIADRRREPGRAIVIENWCQLNEVCFDPTVARYRAVRTQRYIYAEYPNGESELYDLDADPFELTSAHADPAYAEERAALAELLASLTDCAGGECREEPRLRLRLEYETRRERGKRCVRSKVVAEVRGRDSDTGLEATFFVDGKKRGKDGGSRLRETLARRQLERRAKNKISANVAVLDGRVASVAEKGPGRC